VVERQEDPIGRRTAGGRTRHSILSRLAEVLTPDALKSQSQHRRLQRLAHYTVGAKPNHAAMVQAIRPKTMD
jgi:hypothetical protein